VAQTYEFWLSSPLTRAGLKVGGLEPQKAHFAASRAKLRNCIQTTANVLLSKDKPFWEDDMATTAFDNVALTTTNPATSEQLKELIKIHTKPEILEIDRKRVTEIVTEIGMEVNGKSIIEFVKNADQDTKELLQELKIRPDQAKGEIQPNILIIVAAAVVVTLIPGDTPKA
jgi:hypothetical protein